MLGKGVSVGTFFCRYWASQEELNIAFLKNLDHQLHAMPSLEQIHALIKHNGPSVFFHPDGVYLPSFVSRFFKNGALLYRSGDLSGEPIDAGGTNFPGRGKNDGHFGETCLPMTEDILSNRATWKLWNSGGEGVEAYDLEYIAGNRATVYSSKSGHASFPHPGCYIQVSPNLRTGIRNDAARSSLYVDSSIHYENIAAEYLQELS
ncbi:hypothetical protein Peur_049063 [Populus x canadensis]